MKLELLAVCDQAIVDVRTNRLSMISLLDAMQISGLPVFLDEAVVVMQFSRATASEIDNTAHLDVKLGENSLISTDIEVNFGDGLKARHMMGLRGLPITEYGVLSFVASCGKQKAAWTVEIDQEAVLEELANRSKRVRKAATAEAAYAGKSEA